MSLKYWLTRIILLVPTLGAIILMSFFLTRGSINQNILILQENNSKEATLHPRQTHQAYNQEVKSKGLSLPVFYFGLRPIAYNVLDDYDDLRAQSALKKWVQNHSYKKVHLYFQEIKGSLDTIQSSTGYNQLLSLFLNGPEETKTYLNQFPSTLFSEDLMLKFKQAISSSKEITSIFPTLKWNGMDNQFHNYCSHLIQGKLGSSSKDGRAAIEKIKSALSWTLSLTLPVLIIAVLLGWIMAYLKMIYPHFWLTKFTHIFILFLYAMPLFWIATIAIVFFTNDHYAGGWLDWFSGVEIYRPSSGDGMLKKCYQTLKFLFLPAMCMILSGLAFFYLQWKDNAEDWKIKPFILTARSKGITLKSWMKNHVFSNAGYSILGLTGIFFPALVSGSIIIEVLFNIPGMGRLMFTSIKLADWNIVMGIVVLGAVTTYIGFIIADLIMIKLDPRK